MVMNKRIATEAGKKAGQFTAETHIHKAYAVLAPILAERTPFRYLDHIGGTIAKISPHPDLLNALLTHIAGFRTEGGWVIIGSILKSRLDNELPHVISLAESVIIEADIWYGADILAERVPGPALLIDFDNTIEKITTWSSHHNRWVRRAVGVAAHFWTKRARGDFNHNAHAQELLTLFEVMFEERNMDALKGIGWGLKTLGKYYLDLLSEWINIQINILEKKPRALMTRKALTYLSDDAHIRLGLE